MKKHFTNINVKLLSLTLSIVLLFSNFAVNILQVKANTKNVQNHYIIYQYSNGESSNDKIKFEIYSTNKINFEGHLQVKDDSGAVNFDDDVSGTIKYFGNYFECYCEFKTTWVFGIKYNSNATITVYPFSGKANITFGGEGLIALMGEYELLGSKNDFYNSELMYNDYDIRMCLDLSNTMYCSDKSNINIVEKNINELSEKYKLSSISVENYETFINSKSTIDFNKENAPFAMMYRIDEKNNSVDMIVSIRGTYYDEWQGNTEITGETYDEKQYVHYNFEKGKNSIKSAINNYYKKFLKNYNNVNLIITGHSRGAAIANLYAKEATDVTNEAISSNNIPKFNKVIAYTFACPNVERITQSNTIDNMESYGNIYNFWFDTDIVPTVPLTAPTNGWNYWKYGKCYTLNISEYIDAELKLLGINIDDGPLNSNIKNELSVAFSQWLSIEDYYKDNLKAYYHDKYTNNTIEYKTSLFTFLHSATSAKSSRAIKKMPVLMAIKLAKECPQLYPLIGFALNNIGTIANSHNCKNYEYVINGTETLKEILLRFKPYSYEDAVVQYQTTEASIATYDETQIEYNQNEIELLKQFASSGDNNEKLSWDLNNPQSWDGIEWNEEGHVKSIDFTYKWLTGELDCSVFTALENLNLYANSLTGITLNNQKLVSLNCSYNDFSQSGIDLSTCTNLKELYCDGCSLSTLNLANNPELQILSCSFNKLFALNIENNDKLSHISCPYNYLDVHEGGNLYNRFTELQSSKNAYVNYNSQMLTENAVIDTNELQALESFAKHNQNNEELNWLNDNGDIDINKVQNNVYFEFDGEKYKITAIDISNIDVQGDLDLSSFTELTTLYCDNTKITGLNVSNSTKLEDLVCENSEITSLILPVNSAQNSSKLSNIKCQNNHIDINIFTEEIIKNIESKDDYILEYKHQIIEKDISAFDENDYNLLVNFANQRNNNKILDWDLLTPGKWENVSWKFDNASGKYKLLECRFDFMEVKGNIDVSGCDMLDEVSFSGSKINTVTISGKNLNDSTFYGCSELEAVIIKGGSTIYEGTFKMCPTLQAIYIPSNITEIADNAFENLSNITIAGVADSYAQTYANEHNINFKPGAFICGNIVAKEDLDDSYQYYYPVEDVSIVYKDEVQSTSDKLGYFVLFSTESGENQYKLEYPYGYNINQTTSINNNEPLIIENPIGLICYDWINDGYINAKDYVKLLDQIKKGSEITGIDDKYFDINKDGKVTEDDWEFANNFLLYSNPNK